MTIHKPVLLEESVAGLSLKKDSVVVDATLGGGGHSREILKIIGKDGRLIAIDQDQKAVANFKEQLQPEVGNTILVKDNFTNIENILGGLGVKTADAVLADLGYSSIQLEDESYGMSFLKDAPLDMRLDKEGKLTAGEIINKYSQEDLRRIIKEYGEEKFAGLIAKKIAERKKSKPIERTLELVEIINSAVPEKYKHRKDPCLPAGRHPATQTFQALRIEVNSELENLEKFIPAAIKVLSPGGRLAVISFHSLEDRIVKNVFRENARGCICPPEFPKCLCGHKAKIKIITRKPIIPNEAEIMKNPRARSAKLRICEKINPAE